MNIIQVQNRLKDLSDQQLAAQMQDGSVPAYLVIAEFDRRKRMRNSAVPAEPPMSTVADDALMGGVATLPVAEAPAFASGGIVSFANGGTPYDPQMLEEFYRQQAQLMNPRERAARAEMYKELMKQYPRYLERDRAFGMTPRELASPEVRGAADRIQAEAAAPYATPIGHSDINQDTPPPDTSAGGGAPRVEDTGIAGVLGDRTAPAPTSRAAAPTQQGLMGLVEKYMAGTPPEVSTEATDKAAQELRDSLKGREKDNLNMALMQAGFAMMAGTSPYAFENMGKGAMAGLQAYAEGKKDIDDLKKEISALEISAEKARNEGNMVKYRDDMAKLQLLIGLENSALDRATRERIAASTASRADKSEKRAAMVAMTSLSGQLQRLLQTRGQSVDPADRAGIDAQIAQVRGQMEMLAAEFGLPYAATPSSGSSIQDQAAAELERRRAVAR